MNTDEFREQLLIERVQQKRGFPVQRAAADGAHECPQKTAGDFRRVHHRAMPRAQTAGFQPPHGTLAGFFSHLGGRFEIVRIPGNAVPVIALHGTVALGQHRAAQGMPAQHHALQKTVGIAKHADTLMRIHGGSFGIADVGMNLARRVFAFDRQMNGFLRADGPGMVQIQIGKLGGERLRVGQTGVFVDVGIARDAARRSHGLPDRCRRQIGGVGGAFPLAEINGDSQALIAVMLDGFDLAQPGRHRQAAFLGQAGFRGGGALLPCLVQQRLDQGFQSVDLFLIIHDSVLMSLLRIWA